MTADRPISNSNSSPASAKPSSVPRQYQEQSMAAAERFTGYFLSILDGLGEELYQMADQADDHELRRLYFSALQKLYGRRKEFKGEFKKQFLAAIKAEIQELPDPRLASLLSNAMISGVEKLSDTTSPSEAEVQNGGASEAREDRYSRMAKSLPRGSWIAFRRPDGSILKARFTWINRATGVYFFVDRDGQKAVEKREAELAIAFRNGSAALIQSSTSLPRVANNSGVQQ